VSAITTQKHLVAVLLAQAVMGTSYKLHYFDARGVAETTRYMFAATKTSYEDKRYSLTFGVPGDFSTISRPEFDAAKAKALAKM